MTGRRINTNYFSAPENDILLPPGGPDGELGASMRYLNQRYSMPSNETIGVLTDIGTEELGHIEMVAAIVYQLTRNLTPEEILDSPYASYFVDHTTSVYPVSAAGVPHDMKYVGIKGDPIADLNEDLAAEQKARVTYDNILRLTDDPDVLDPIRFLREREIVHFQRFGECLSIVQMLQCKRTSNYHIPMPTSMRSCGCGK